MPPERNHCNNVDCLLVCLLEYWTNKRQQRQQQEALEQYQNAAAAASSPAKHQDILDPGGIWRRMPMNSTKRSTPDHVLDDAGVTLGQTYPAPIVDHANARERALELYKEIKG